MACRPRPIRGRPTLPAPFQQGTGTRRTFGGGCDMHCPDSHLAPITAQPVFAHSPAGLTRPLEAEMEPTGGRSKRRLPWVSSWTSACIGSYACGGTREVPIVDRRARPDLSTLADEIVHARAEVTKVRELAATPGNQRAPDAQRQLLVALETYERGLDTFGFPMPHALRLELEMYRCLLRSQRTARDSRYDNRGATAILSQRDG